MANFSQELRKWLTSASYRCQLMKSMKSNMSNYFSIFYSLHASVLLDKLLSETTWPAISVLLLWANVSKKESNSYACLQTITQLLDVSVFSSMKANWRRILQDWKRTLAGKKFGTLPKQQFTALLKRLVLSLKDENLKSRFRAFGINIL